MRNHPTLIKTIQKQISQANLEEAFNLLLPELDANTAFSELEQEVRHLQSRHSHLQRKENLGIISQNEAKMEQNQITYALLTIVEGLEKGENRPPPSSISTRKEVPKPIKLKNTSYRWLIAIVGLLIIFGIIYNEMKPKDFDLLIVFYGTPSKEKVLQGGEVRFLYGDDSKTKTTDKEGGIKLYNLEPNLKGSNLKINPFFKGYSQQQLEVPIPKTTNLLEVVIQPL